MNRKQFISGGVLLWMGAFLTACTNSETTPRATCSVSLHVLGVAQDGGKPQIGNARDPAWADPSLRRLATSLALIDRRGAAPKRWLFEATPDIKEQLYRLEREAPSPDGPPVDGVFLTHAHVGHYAGLMLFGHEAMGAKAIKVYAMARMANFLAQNGPWSQLVAYGNISIDNITDGEAKSLAEGLSVTPFLVPHRQEFSEVVGFRIDGPERSAIFIPDIDSWEDWDAEGARIEDKIASVDFAFLDATFFANGEIPGRDMSGFPHPFVSHSMKRFTGLSAADKDKVRFIHMNHTNPLHKPDGSERREVKEAGFHIADEGDEICL